VANCTNCSAPLPQESIKCTYCGSRNDTDLKGVHYYTTHEIESERICPRCSIRLRTIDLNINGRFLIERCDQCLGLFFDPNELETLLEATVSNVFTINKTQLDACKSVMRASEQSAFYVKCPVCSKIMNRVNFGTNSGVIVDRCKDHGLWLDGGELRHLFEWMKAGGKLLQKEREEDRKREEVRKQDHEKHKLPAQPSIGSSCQNDSDFSIFGGTLKGSDPDLFDIVIKAAGYFMK